uniref:Uncharacterized protein n=1 Tax=Heterorhabditis bacteriophora TaxID=37862 RepID=A0A1I7WH02_HETBA
MIKKASGVQKGTSGDRSVLIPPLSSIVTLLGFIYASLWNVEYHNVYMRGNALYSNRLRLYAGPYRNDQPTRLSIVLSHSVKLSLMFGFWVDINVSEKSDLLYESPLLKEKTKEEIYRFRDLSFSVTWGCFPVREPCLVYVITELKILKYLSLLKKSQYIKHKITNQVANCFF